MPLVIGGFVVSLLLSLVISWTVVYCNKRLHYLLRLVLFPAAAACLSIIFLAAILFLLWPPDILSAFLRW